MNSNFLKILLTLMLSVSLGQAQQKGRTVTNLSPAQAAQAIKKNPEIIIIDIRTPAEFTKSHLPNARNIDFKSPDFEKKIAQLDRNKTYLMHCGSGGRSARSIPVWKKLGFKKILHLKTGLLGAEQVKLALEQK